MDIDNLSPSASADLSGSSNPDSPLSSAPGFVDAWHGTASETEVSAAGQKTPAGGQNTEGKTVLFGREQGDASDISPNDIHQNQIGDCYLDSTMGELALKDPNAIRGMIHDNGNGTYDVTLHQQKHGFHNLWGLFGNDYEDQKFTVSPKAQSGAVNSQKPDPVQVGGAHELWPQLLEQAYAQQQGGFSKIGNGGWPSAAMESLTGHGASETAASGYGFNQLQSDFNSGKMVVLDTGNIGAGANPLGLVGPHAYMVTGVASLKQGQFVTLQNPWGVGTSGGGPAVKTVPYAQLQPYLTNASVGTTH